MADFIFWGSKITADSDCSHEMKIHFLLGRKALTNLGSLVKRRDITLLTKVHIIRAMVFPVVMYGCWELDHKEGWALKNWYFWTVVLENALESPLDCKDIRPVHPKGNQSWIFTGRTRAEAEAPVLWSHDIKDWLIGKDPGAGKDGRQEEKGMTEDEMIGWHHQLMDMSLNKLWELVMNKRKREPENMAWCSPWDCKKLDRTDWTELNTFLLNSFISMWSFS